MKKILAAALASVMLVGGAALAAADGELNICSPNSDGLLSIIPVFEEQTGIKVNVESIGTGDCMKRIESEIAQEYSTFDLMYGGSLANYVANAGLFQDYVSEQDQYLMDAYKNTRGYCTNYTIDGSVLLVNTDMLKELGVEVRGFFSTSVGEAMQMIPFEERDHTAILVDVGYLSTEVMAVEGDALIWQKVLPVGGAHITLDLTYGLEKPFDMCEKIKRAYTFNAPKNTQIEVQGENGQMESFSGEQVSMIIHAR